jgi:hypothetical protein
MSEDSNVIMSVNACLRADRVRSARSALNSNAGNEAEALRQEIPHQLAVHIGQSEIAPGVTISQLLVIEA